MNEQQKDQAQRLSFTQGIEPTLFDGYAVYNAMSEKAKARTSADNVADVLDAAVRVIRAERTSLQPAAAATPAQQSNEWKLVPVNPTVSMIQRAAQHITNGDEPESPRDRHEVIGRLHAIWTDMLAAAPSQGTPAQEREAPQIIQFLLGEASINGFWFGDEHPAGMGPFWWRTQLREYAARAAAPSQATATGDEDSKQQHMAVFAAYTYCLENGSTMTPIEITDKLIAAAKYRAAMRQSNKEGA